MKILPITFALILFAINAQSQSLFEKLGGVETNFTIVSNSNDLSILSQGVIKRNITETDNFHSGLSTLKAGYSYEVHYLEFITTSDIVELYKLQQPTGRTFYELNLYDDADNLLYTYTLGSKWAHIITSEAGLKTYSFDLNRTPMILLNKTKKISIEKVKTTSFKGKLKKNPK